MALTRRIFSVLLASAAAAPRLALAQARDAIVSRNDLVDACWGGVAVSDDAINRCIQKLRRLALRCPR